MHLCGQAMADSGLKIRTHFGARDILIAVRHKPWLVRGLSPLSLSLSLPRLPNEQVEASVVPRRARV